MSKKVGKEARAVSHLVSSKISQKKNLLASFEIPLREAPLFPVTLWRAGTSGRKGEGGVQEEGGGPRSRRAGCGRDLGHSGYYSPAARVNSCAGECLGSRHRPLRRRVLRRRVLLRRGAAGATNHQTGCATMRTAESRCPSCCSARGAKRPFTAPKSARSRRGRLGTSASAAQRRRRGPGVPRQRDLLLEALRPPRRCALRYGWIS